KGLRGLDVLACLAHWTVRLIVFHGPLLLGRHGLAAKDSAYRLAAVLARQGRANPARARTR
ncbi:MAG: hypothetical protein AAGK37_24145, partial [Pseudomonadota bacterium]